MASEASQRQFRGSRNAFNKFAKELSIGIVDASKDSQCFEAEIKQFEELYNIVGYSLSLLISQGNNVPGFKVAPFQSHQDKSIGSGH